MRDDLIERLNEAWRKLYGDGDEHGVCDTLAEAAAALEAAREDGARLDWLADQMRIADLHFILDSVPLEPCELRAAIDREREKGVADEA